ncbi:MAG: hypothetical protein ABL874_09885, partial [Sphingopyxis sp.]
PRSRHGDGRVRRAYGQERVGSVMGDHSFLVMLNLFQHPWDDISTSVVLIGHGAPWTLNQVQGDAFGIGNAA